MAKASGRPVAVTCTSGTAAANLAPRRGRGARGARAADRAHRRPAAGAARRGRRAGDRPARSSTARAAKWFVEVGNHEPGRATRRAPPRARLPRLLAPRAAGGPGPVHLNFPLREPLAPVAEELDAADWAGPRRTGGRGPSCAATRGAPDADDVQALARGWRPRRAGRDRLRADAPRTWPSRSPGWRPRPAGRCSPSPTSGVRCGAHDRSHVVAHYDVLLRGERFAGAHRPTSCCASATRPPRSRCAPGSRRAAGRARPARGLARADPRAPS